MSLAVQSDYTSIDDVIGIGVFQTYYESNQLSGMSPSTVAWITSLETFVMFFAVCDPQIKIKRTYELTLTGPDLRPTL